MSKRIIIAGGGTGGHIFPAVAVARALQRLEPATELLFVGARGKMEMEKIPQAGFRIEGLSIAGFNRSAWWKNLMLPYLLLKSFWQVRTIFRKFNPQAAFGVGGYSSYPVLRYAQARGIPTFLHESNAFGGKTNQMLARKIVKAFVAHEGMERFFPAGKIVISGNPVRREIWDNSMAQSDARKAFGLQPEPLTLLVIGGSQGARSINHAIHQGLDRWLQSGYQLIWQTGKLYTDEARKAVVGRQGVYTNSFIAEMDKAYAAADMVISRSGAMSVTELCLVGKPAIFVPFPFAAEDHQTANALALVNQRAALMIADGEAANRLMDAALELAANERQRKEMKNNIATLARPDADEVIAREILQSIA